MHLSHRDSSIHCTMCITPDFLDQIRAIPLSEPDTSGLSVVNFSDWIPQAILLVRFGQNEFSGGFLKFEGCHSFGPLFGAGGVWYKTRASGRLEDNLQFVYHSTENMTPSIIATCKQTRFHLLDDNASQEVSPIHRPLPSVNCVLLTPYLSD